MATATVEPAGTIFDIQRFSTGDGPGIRTLVFFKGCPLRCIWCANPESQKAEPEIIYYSNKCVGCGRCVESCPDGAIHPDDEFGLITDAIRCSSCGVCENVCWHDARKLLGKRYTVSEVMDIVARDKLAYETSGGGVTLSGGEPLSQPGFAEALARRLKEEQISTAIETCGNVAWETLAHLLPYLDLVFFDIKHLSPGAHQRFTGASNAVALENLTRLSEVFDNVTARIPFIPGCNDDDDTIRGILEYVKLKTRVTKVEIMPYHRLGLSKYRGLGRIYDLAHVEPVNRNDIMYLEEMGHEMGMEVKVGSQ